MIVGLRHNGSGDYDILTRGGIRSTQLAGSFTGPVVGNDKTPTLGAEAYLSFPEVITSPFIGNMDNFKFYPYGVELSEINSLPGSDTTPYAGS